VRHHTDEAVPLKVQCVHFSYFYSTQITDTDQITVRRGSLTKTPQREHLLSLSTLRGGQATKYENAEFYTP